MNILRLCLLLFTWPMFATSCAHKPLSLDSFAGSQTIREGEAAQLAWKFSNADSVVLRPGHDRYSSTSTASVAPLSTTEYRIVAFSSDGDSLVKPWVVAVIPRKRTADDIMRGPHDDIQRGPMPLFQSDIPSPYLRGFTNERNKPYALRILSASVGERTADVQATVIDSLGNFISGIADDALWTFEVFCQDHLQVSVPPVTVSEESWLPSSRPLNTVLAIEHSAAAPTLAGVVLNAMPSTLSSIATRDTLSVVLFGSELTVAVEPMLISDLSARLVDEAFGKGAGLTATFSTLRRIVSGMRSISEAQRQIVLVVEQQDNASVATSISKVIELANEVGVTIHVIHVGVGVQRYAYRALAVRTGGRYYGLSGTPASVGAIVRELIYSSRIKYHATVPLNATDMCTEYRIQLRVTIGGVTVADSVKLVNANLPPAPGERIVAAFSDHDDDDFSQYESLIAALAEYLLSNPIHRVELVGHVGRAAGGNGDKRSYERARRIVDRLSDLGVPAAQVSVRGAGSSKPIYYFELEPQHKVANNRVEVRSLNEEDKPFTIVVGAFSTEEQALSAVLKWEERGYAAYFDPVIDNGEPTYRVLLWGYSSYREANSTATEIRKKYKTRGVVE